MSVEQRNILGIITITVTLLGVCVAIAYNLFESSQGQISIREFQALKKEVESNENTIIRLWEAINRLKDDRATKSDVEKLATIVTAISTTRFTNREGDILHEGLKRINSILEDTNSRIRIKQETIASLQARIALLEKTIMDLKDKQ